MNISGSGFSIVRKAAANTAAALIAGTGTTPGLVAPAVFKAALQDISLAQIKLVSPDASVWTITITNNGELVATKP